MLRSNSTYQNQCTSLAKAKKVIYYTKVYILDTLKKSLKSSELGNPYLKNLNGIFVRVYSMQEFGFWFGMVIMQEVWCQLWSQHVDQD